MFGSLFLLFTVIPALEIFLLFKLGSFLGPLNTFLLIILTGIIGAYYAKSQGLLILNRIQSKLQEGSMPSNDIIQGLIILIGGILLITPGVITDLVGLSMVFPITRLFFISLVKSYLVKGIKSGNVHFYTFNSSSQSSQQNNSNDYIEAEFKETENEDV